MEAWFNRAWYERTRPVWWLLPLEYAFIAASFLRRWLYARGILHSRRLDIPVVVVGNIAVGGTGKTPLVLHLARSLREHGWKPGIVSRGHGGNATDAPRIVAADDSAAQVGDEPLMLAQAGVAPVCVFPKRVQAVEHLLRHGDVDVVISDDGLQHYALQRDVEIAVVDAGRGVGNGHRLPAGPLREPVSRLAEVDLVVAQGPRGRHHELPIDSFMALQPAALVNLRDGSRKSLPDEIPASLLQDAVAIAGIGNPHRFFALLEKLGIAAETRMFADHHPFRAEDFTFAGNRPTIMTTKDAVKCRAFAEPNWWYLEVIPEFDVDPALQVLELLERWRQHHE